MKNVTDVFPDPETADDEGLLVVGGDLSSPVLLEAYSKGIFPWPYKNLPLLWFAPDPRAVLDFEDLHLPRSLIRFLKRTTLSTSRDQAFDQVIELCAKVKRTEKGTWIRSDMITAYKRLHREGHAHSVEVWNQDRLVGGIYGVLIHNVFSGESMFHLETNASKVALLEMVKWLKELGSKWMDIQMLTPLLKSLGGKTIPRKEFTLRLHKATK